MAVVTRGDRTYQASDLAGTSRRSFINEARGGLARLRDQDGASLVMLPEADLATLSGLRVHFLAYLSLENALLRPRSARRPTDFGEVAWADALDEDDLAEFRDEFRDELTRAVAGRSLDDLNELLRAWRLTADLVGDDEAMARLDDDDLVDVPRPEDSV